MVLRGLLSFFFFSSALEGGLGLGLVGVLPLLVVMAMVVGDVPPSPPPPSTSSEFVIDVEAEVLLAGLLIIASVLRERWDWR
jgi:hypothetical protein